MIPKDYELFRDRNNINCSLLNPQFLPECLPRDRHPKNPVV